MTKIRRLRAASALGVCAMGTAMGAVAADAKQYSGAFCTFADGDNSNQDRQASKFQNTSTSTQRVACPLLKEDLAAEVEYANIIADARIDEDTCRFYMRKMDGGWSSWLHNDVDATGGNMNKTEFFAGSVWADVDIDASFSIECDMTSGKSVMSYRMDDQ